MAFVITEVHIPFSFPLVEVVYFLLMFTGVRLTDIVDSKFQLNLIVEDGTGVPKTTICTLVLMLWLWGQSSL